MGAIKKGFVGETSNVVLLQALAASNASVFMHNVAQDFEKVRFGPGSAHLAQTARLGLWLTSWRPRNLALAELGIARLDIHIDAAYRALSSADDERQRDRQGAAVSCGATRAGRCVHRARAAAPVEGVRRDHLQLPRVRVRFRRMRCTSAIAPVARMGKAPARLIAPVGRAEPCAGCTRSRSRRPPATSSA